jgi:hypothetical protein
MKISNHIKYLSLFIVVCIISSCKLTGNFAVVKRQHSDGYYLQIPSLIQKNNTVELKKRNKFYIGKNTICKNKPENTTTLNNTSALAETEKPQKKILQSYINKAPESFLKHNGKDSSKKKTPTDTSKRTITKPSENIQTTDPFAKAALITSIPPYILLPLSFAVSIFYHGAFPDILIGLLSFSSLILPLLAIIFGIIGLRRIKKNPEKLNGKSLARAAIIVGSLFYVFFIAVVIVFIYAFTIVD